MLNPMAWGLGACGGGAASNFFPQRLYDPMTAIMVASTVAGTAISAAGTIAGGRAAKKSADYEAAQLDIRAKDEQAAGQREAEQYARKRDLTLSNLQARAGASGFSATDPTSLALADEISRYGTLQEKTALFGGESRRESLEAQAEGHRFTGQAAKIGSNYKAAATILGGVSTLADRYAPKPASLTEDGGLRYGRGRPSLVSDDYGEGGWRTTTSRYR